MEEFKRTQILPYILKTEHEENVVGQWLEHMDEHPIDYDDLAITDPTVPPKPRPPKDNDDMMGTDDGKAQKKNKEMD